MKLRFIFQTGEDMKQKIPTVTFNPEKPFEQHPQRPFCMNVSKSVYRYGNRFNVITNEKQKTVLVDLGRLGKAPEDAEDPRPYFEVDVDLIKTGRRKFVVVKEIHFPLSEVLTTTEDIFPHSTFKGN
jgi:hypothetical protein